MSKGQSERGLILEGEHLRAAARDVRYLLDNGYPKESSIRFVSDHYRLSEEERFVIVRVTVPSKVAESRERKALRLGDLSGRELFVDGYNVLITVESLLERKPVYRCDDGYLRDTRGIFRYYRPSGITPIALAQILDLIALAKPSLVTVLLDSQMSLSGELACTVRSMMADRSIPGIARAVKNVDRQLKSAGSVVSTADGNILDAIEFALDIPSELASCLAIPVWTA
jgi:hypothetical protein